LKNNNNLNIILFFLINHIFGMNGIYVYAQFHEKLIHVIYKIGTMWTRKIINKQNKITCP